MHSAGTFYVRILVVIALGMLLFSLVASAAGPAELSFDFKDSQFTAPPVQGLKNQWNQLVISHTPHHNGYDMIFRQGERQYIAGKFQYGDLRKDLEGETIRIYVWSFANPGWRFLRQMTTDTDGRIQYNIPSARRLAAGLHLVKLYVAADGTQANMYIQVLNKTAKYVVFDIDGTLTVDDDEIIQEYLNELWDGTYVPEAHPHALEVVTYFAVRGYNILYLTARPYWLSEKTQHWLKEQGFPRGIIHTYEGAEILTSDNVTIGFKTKYLQGLIKKGVNIAFAYGNTPADYKAYRAAGVPAKRIFKIAP